jgi:hypothetical protein
MLLHSSGQRLIIKASITLGGKYDSQAIGCACTYGRRYGLAAMVGLAQIDDDGNSNVNK